VSSIPDVLLSPALAHDYSDLSGEELLRVCADLRNAAAWDELIRRFHAPIYAAVLRTGQRYAQFQRSLCDDLVQETYLRLAPHQAKALREFVPRHTGSACRYLQVIAVRVTHDCCKKNDFRRLQELPVDPPDIAAPDKTEWLAWLAEIGDMLREHATARDCQIFRLYYLQGMRAKEIAALASIGLTVKGVESVVVRLKRLIQEYFGGGERE
jgi:RNA polymerase sigma factor (sigma-70 family)